MILLRKIYDRYPQTFKRYTNFNAKAGLSDTIGYVGMMEFFVGYGFRFDFGFHRNKGFFSDERDYYFYNVKTIHNRQVGYRHFEHYQDMIEEMVITSCIFLENELSNGKHE